MRLAVVVAPSDPRAGDAVARREALAWLRGQLARNGFEVLIVGGGTDPQAALDKAAARVSPGDALFVHLSGRLGEGASLAFGGGRVLPLTELAATFAARAPAEMAFIAELMHPQDADDARAGGATAEAVADALRSHPNEARLRPCVLVAVRLLATRVARLAFTESTLTIPGSGEMAPSPSALVASMHRRADAGGGIEALAPWHAFAPASADEEHLDVELVEPVADEELLPPEASEATPVPVAAEEAPRPPPAEDPTAAVAFAADTLAADPPTGDALRSPDTVELDALMAAATDARDWQRVLELRLTRLGVLEDRGLQVRELIAVARLLQGELGDPEGAIATLEQARTIEPDRASVLRALRRGYETLGRWASALEVIGVLVEMAVVPADRAALRVAQARIAVDRIGDESHAAQWLHAALIDDPENAEAAARLARLTADPIETDIVIDAEPSMNALPADDDPYGERGVDGIGLDQLEAMAAHSPFEASTYAKTHFLYLQDANTDAAFLAAMALEELGAADLNQQGLVDHFRSVSPVRARASLDVAAWELLRAPGYDDVLAAIFVAIERAAIAVRVEDLREQRRLPAIDRDRRLSETSTASIVRSFQWAARFLGIGCPDLYVVEEARGVVSLQGPDPSTALGPAVLSGQSAKDLAFLAGHHLTRYRPEYRLLSYYPSREDVTMLLFAAAQLGMPQGGAPDGASSVRSLRTRIARHLGPREHAALVAAVARLDARGGQATIGAWLRSMELTAARAGLLLCGDLMTASALARSDLCAVAEPPVDARRGDLIAFCASRAHAELRARFVTSAGSSVRHTENLGSLAEGRQREPSSS